MFYKQLTHVIDLFYAVRENIPSTGQKDWKILSFCREKNQKNCTTRMRIVLTNHHFLMSLRNHNPLSNLPRLEVTILYWHIRVSFWDLCIAKLPILPFILIYDYLLTKNVWIFFTKYSLVTWRSTNKKSLPWFAEIMCSAQSLVPLGFHINQAVNF